MGKTLRLEGKASISSRKRSVTKGSGSSYPYFCNELLQIAGGFVQRD